MRFLPSELWNSPVIRKRLWQEAGFECDHGISAKQQYWCMVPQADSGTGVQILRNFDDSPMNCDPHELQQAFAREIMGELQKEAGMGGFWLVGFTHPPSNYGVITETENCWNRMIAIWFDGDGDPQYTVETDRPFIDQARMGAASFVGIAAQAHGKWLEMYGPKAMKSDMMLKEGQTSKAALEALR
jgi:hypothetical protein